MTTQYTRTAEPTESKPDAASDPYKPRYYAILESSFSSQGARLVRPAKRSRSSQLAAQQYAARWQFRALRLGWQPKLSDFTHVR